MGDKLYRITFDNYLNKSPSQYKTPNHKNNLSANTKKALKQRHQAETSINKLNEHLQNVPERYRSFIDFIYPYLCNTQLYFTLPYHHIMIQNGAIIFSNAAGFFSYFNYGKTSDALDFYIDFNDFYFQKLYELYYSYLKCYADIPSPYNRYFANIFKSINSKNILYQIFMNPYAHFHMLNKELALTNYYYEDNGVGQDITSILQKYGISANKLVPMLKIVPKLLDNSAFHTSVPCCRSNYSFNFSFRENIFYAYFTNEGIKYDKCRNEYIQLISLVDLEHFTKGSPMQSWVDVLYAITGGIKKNMDNFSMICALIMTNYYKNINYALPSKNCLPLSLYIIYAPEGKAAILHDFLEELIPSGYVKTDYQLKDIAKSQNILSLIRQNYIYPSYIPVRPSETKESETQITTIKKIIQRKEINIKDSHGLKHTLINHLPVICFVDNPKQLSYLQANFTTKIFSFMPHNASLDAECNNEDYKSFINFLSIYGLKTIFDRSFQHDVRPNESITTESITQCFINDCIKPEPNHAWYADDLYYVYSRYYQLFYEGSPLSKICFTKELRKILPYDYEYKKPRHSRSDNRYAFVGISIDVDKAAKAAKDAENIRADISKKSVSDYLANVQNSVNEIIQSLHSNFPERP